MNKITRNIVTHHAEDGSGVGSAIIAGKTLNENTICPFFFTHKCTFSNDKTTERRWVVFARVVEFVFSRPPGTFIMYYCGVYCPTCCIKGTPTWTVYVNLSQKLYRNVPVVQF